MDEEQSNLIKRTKPQTSPINIKNLLKEDTPLKPKLFQTDEKFCKNYILFSICFILGLMVFLVYGYKTTLNDSKLSRLIEKPMLDSRVFKFMELSNDIKIFLVQDNSTETSSFSLELSVGFNAETGEIPGVSHMLAHLILMNSKSYPNFYLEYFLKNHGGDANLMIDVERTNLYFSVNFQFFEKAVEIFIKHLKEPNFIKETFPETIDMIDREFFEEMENNNNKILSLVKKLSDQGHIFSKFFIGNKESLFERPAKNKIDVLSEIDWYFNEYYSGNLMNIAIVSNHSIEFLEKIVKEHFLHLKNNRMPSKNMALYPKPFPFNEIHQVILFESETNGLEVSLLFPMKEIISSYRTKPLNYIVSLFNNKEIDSFYDFLVKRKLVYEMESEILYEGSDFTLFSCKFTMPKEAQDKIKEVIQLFYAFVDLMISFGVKKELFDEMKKISSVLFHFEEKNDDFSEAQRIARNLNFLPLSNLLNGDKIFFDFDEKAILSFLNFINPKNSITTITSKGFDINEDSVRMQQLNQDENDLLNYNENNNNVSHVFRFTDLNSLKEELKVLKEKTSFKSKMLPNKYKMMNMLLLNDSNNELNETDYSEVLKISLDSFDDLNKIYYRILPLSEKTIIDLNEMEYSYLKGKVEIPEKNQFIPMNLNLFSKCKEKPSVWNHSNISQNLVVQNQKSKENITNSILVKLSSDKFYNLTVNSICYKEKDPPAMEIIDYNHTSFQIFYKFENHHNIPKVSLYLDLIFNSTVYTTKTNMMFLIVNQILNKFMEKLLYKAIVAGNFFEIKANHHGFEIYLEGFNYNFPFLCETFLNGFFKIETNEFLFKRIKETLITKIKEEKLDDPIKKSTKMFQKIMTNYNHIYQEKIYELEGIDFNMLEEFLQNFKENLVINKIFIYGNYLKNDTFEILETIIHSFKEALKHSIKNNTNSNKTMINAEEKNKTTINFEQNETNQTLFNTSSDNLSSIANLIEGNLTNNETSNIPNNIILNFNDNNTNLNLTINNFTNVTNSSFNFNTTENSSQKIEKKNETETNVSNENMRSLFYSNVSYIPLTFLNISSMNIRFLFDDQKNDFEDKYILLNYFQLGPRKDSKNSSLLSMISLYLDTKFDDFIRNYSSFPQRSIKKMIQTHIEKNIDGLLIVLELKNDLNITCIEYLLEKFYEMVHYEISGMTTRELESLKNKTLHLLSKIDVKFRQKSKRIWQEILNGHALDYYQVPDIKALVQITTKTEIHDFFFENFINRANQLSIKIVRKDKNDNNNDNLNNNNDSKVIGIEKNNEFVCGINVKIIKKLNYYRGFIEDSSTNNAKGQFENLQGKLNEEIQHINTKSKKTDIENINELNNIPKYVFYF